MYQLRIYDCVEGEVFFTNFDSLLDEFQFCLKLSFLAALPPSYGGLAGRVIYIDVESKFSSRRYFKYPMLLVISIFV